MNFNGCTIEDLLEKFRIDDFQGWSNDLLLYGAGYSRCTPSGFERIPADSIYYPVGWDERDAKI